MKRRILSFIITLTLCLNLCPVQAFAAGGGMDDGVCPHHPAHTDECGYVPGNPGALCTFACQICPVEDLIGKLPGSVSENNSGQVRAQLSEIYDLYDGLIADEQQQVDLSPSVSLQDQLDGMGLTTLSDGSGDSPSLDQTTVLSGNVSYSSPYELSSLLRLHTNGFTFTGTNSTAIRITGTGALYLAGTVVSQKGVGIEVQSKGFLSITEPASSVSGTTYALDIASGAEVHLSTGTYTGRSAAIRTADGDFAALLEQGYAYFDSNGSLLLPADAVGVKKLVIDQCTDHPGRSFTHDSGATTHTWTCPYCSAEETEACTFTFSQDGNGTCVSCENTITIAVDEDDLTGLVYDGTVKPEDVSITVTLTDGSNKELEKDTDYKVVYEPRTDAGEITVTVTGITFNGTFTKTYHVEQDQPGIKWDATTRSVDYDSRGIPVDSTSLPPITIKANGEDLHQYLQYFYRKTGDTEFTEGLPTKAGVYEIKAYIPESQNYKAAETDPYLTLTISKIPAVAAAPTAKTLTYNREAQELVTAGVLEPGAAAEGAVIEFARASAGPYSTDIPTGITVRNYDVWYRVADTENYTGQSGKLSARISHKEVTPTVELEYKTTVYTGGDKEPAVTVKDGETVIPNSEYTVAYSNNRNVGTATVTVSNANNGNYNLATVTAAFKITNQPQAALSITSKPNTVIYGDQFTLGTQGGSGNGDVTWKITAGLDAAAVDEHSGQVTVTGHGSVTVQATKSGKDPATGVVNYDDATASWTFSAGLKPVTATVTADDKPYNGDRTATVHASVPDGELVSGDSITITGVTGTFDDANAGTNKKVTVDSSNASADGTNAKNYEIAYPATTTASILAEAATVDPEPEAKDLTYDASQAQLLVTEGTATGGIMVYSLDGANFTPSRPTAKDAGTYTVYFKAQGDGNHTDSEVKSKQVTIAKQSVTPQIELTPPSAQYDGTVKRPGVILRDKANNVIPASEYKVTYVSDNGKNWTDTGTYDVRIEDVVGGNYVVATVTEQFTISATAQNPLEITNKPGLVYYGDTFTLSAVGGSGNAAVTWSADNAGVVEIDPNGFVKIVGVGSAVITATKSGGTNYGTVTATYPLNALKKPITPTVTAKDKPYDGSKTATLRAVWKTGDMVNGDTIDLTVTGEFVTADAGANKQVTILSHEAIGATADKYTITWPDTTTASIYKVDAKLACLPAAASLTYTGEAQLLLVGGTTVGGIGTIVYSMSQNGAYSEDIPTGTDAGTYTVWYKVADSVNYTGIPAAAVEVEIAKANPTISTKPTATGSPGQKLSEIRLEGGATSVPGKFAWEDGSTIPVDGNSYNVIFTPDDTANYDPDIIQVIVTLQPASSSSIPANIPFSAPDASGAETNPSGTPAQTGTPAPDGTASTVVSDEEGSRLVQEAVTNQSQNVVIKPEISGDVTKTEVSIPASTVGRLGSETDAALTISSPFADVTLSNAALDALGQAGGTVSVVTEKVEQSVALTLSAGGEIVEEVPGGLTLTVPVEDAGPGTVAVLVHDDGTRETVRKSVAADGVISIPLSGSATVEIVDNSKDFADVSPESWAADAVDFASSHELFNGTSDTTFSPDLAMSRGMLATVLYRLESSPELDLTDAFNDVSDDAWYAEGVAWAVENGIADGYGDGQFGPDDNITREQFVVMLWRYAGSPEASSQALAFADADQVSSYAQEALCWAVENGILRGEGSGVLDPRGTATRAQVAQLLKNFIENT